MGGKVWSDEEERVFWSEIVPTSSKRHLLAKPYTDDAKGWESLRKVMQANMGRRARRKYTALMLYEHYFQNSVLERFSPNAARYVREYIKNERSSTGQAPSERSRSVMRFVQRGRGSGRRPKNLHAIRDQGQSSMPERQDQDQDLDRDRDRDRGRDHGRDQHRGQDRHQQNQAQRHFGRQLQRPLPLLFSPPPAAVRLPPLSALDPSPAVFAEASALCEPDYDFSYLPYEEVAYEAPAYASSSAYHPPDIKVPVYQAPAYTAAAYTATACKAPIYEPPVCEVPVYEAPVYKGPLYEAPVYEVSVYKTPVCPAPAYQTPVSQAPTPADSSLFVKQEVAVAGPEDVKLPAHVYEEFHRREELRRYEEAAGEWYE